MNADVPFNGGGTATPLVDVYARDAEAHDVPGAGTVVCYGLVRDMSVAAGPWPIGAGDGVAITIMEGELGWKLSAERGITSSSELFAVQHDDGILFTDSFAAACAVLLPAQREYDEVAVASHLLFRTVPGDRTYLRRVHRLGHGQRWELTPTDRTPRVVYQDVLDARAATAVPPALDRTLEEATDAVVRLVRRRGWCGANLLSGGVDSTLLHSYLPNFDSVHAVTESPEFRIEGQYAADAAAVLGARHQRIAIMEGEYLANLQSSITAIGMPPQHLQTVLLDAAFTGDADAFVTAQFADALFGLPSSAHATSVARLAQRVPSTVLAMGRLAPGAIGRKLRTAQRTSASLARATDDQDGFAQRFAVYADPGAVVRLLGSAAVRAAYEQRTAYVSRIAPHLPYAQSGLASHLETGHLIDFFTDDAVSIWRQLAHARGKELFAPFTDRAVVLESFADPSPGRFIRDGRVKPTLKKLLQQRVPAYEIDKPKQASGLPFERYYESGPLSDVWSAYAVPDFVARGATDPDVARGTSTAWNLVTWAIWDADVVRNPKFRVGVTPLVSRRVRA